MKKLLLLIALIFGSFMPFTAYAGSTFNPHTSKPDKCVTVEEEDGSPSNIVCGKVKVSDGSLTDNGDGTFSLTTGGGGAGGGGGAITLKVDNVGIGTTFTALDWNSSYFTLTEDVADTEASFVLNSSWRGWTDGGTNVYVTTSTDVVGIGTVSALEKLQVVNNIDDDTSIRIDNTSNTSSAYVRVQMNTADTGLALASFPTNGTGIFSEFAKGNGIYTLSNGATSPDLFFANRVSGGVIKFYTGGSAASNRRMTIDGNGNVGIGTTFPDSGLDVEHVYASGNGVDIKPNVAVSVLQSDVAAMHLRPMVTNNIGGLDVTSFKALRIDPTNRTDAGGTVTDVFGIYVDADTGGANVTSAYFGNNVGIGTTLPSVPLSVVSSSTTVGLVTKGTGTAAVGMGSNSSGAFVQGYSDITFGASSPLILQIVPGSNVGIGTALPRQNLEVAGNAVYGSTTLADATSITPNCAYKLNYQANTQAVGTLTVNAPTCAAPVNGLSYLIKIKSTNVQTFSWNAAFDAGDTALPTASSGASEIDYYAFIYDAVNSKYHYTGGATGF